MRDINTFPRHDYSFVSVEDYFKLKASASLITFLAGLPLSLQLLRRPGGLAGLVRLHQERMVGEIANLWRRYHFTDLNLQDETYFTQQKRGGYGGRRLFARRAAI